MSEPCSSRIAKIRVPSIIYTIVECCRRRGLDPAAYLNDVLTRLPKMTNWQISEVTPAAWQKSLKQQSFAA